MGELILTKARELFFSYGLKSVSMDDLARLSGVSKKTIYQFFSDKADLIHHLVDELIGCHQQRFRHCQLTANDAVDEVLKQSHEPFETWAAVSRTFFYELEKSFPDAWTKLVEHRQNVLLPGIRKNLKRGVDEGLYRSEMDLSFVADVRLQQLQQALQPTTFTGRRMTVTQWMNELTVFYLHGITTEKGKKLLTKYLQNRNENKSTQEQSTRQ